MDQVLIDIDDNDDDENDENERNPSSAQNGGLDDAESDLINFS
jgi:hypothetical protein